MQAFLPLPSVSRSFMKLFPKPKNLYTCCIYLWLKLIHEKNQKQKIS
jgi:hypothetical protein